MENNTTVSLSLDEAKIAKMKEFYKENIYPNKNEHVSTLIKTDNLTITIYHSNKVVFQGKDAEYEASIWGDTQQMIWKYNKEHIGSDEVGTGDYFGPMCVCASYITENDIEWLNSLGVNDSKTLTDEKIIKIAPELIKRIPYSQMSVDPVKYNSLITSGYNQGKIKAMLHNQVIHNLREKLKNYKVKTIVDQFATESKYYEYIQYTKNIERNITFETKAESKYPAVAVSSIIARYSFLVKMTSLSKSVGKIIPKGAGEQVDSFGKEIVSKYGEGKLKELAKWHFANTKKILHGDKQE